MELTTLGVGTYWYQAPECFSETEGQMITNKVDVWSVGIVLYEMLFGKRPFGHNLTSSTIHKEQTIRREGRELSFPPKPKVSSKLKLWLKKCLTYYP